VKIYKLTIINQLYVFILVSAIFAFIFEIVFNVSNMFKMVITILLYMMFIIYLNYQIFIIKYRYLYFSIFLLFFLVVSCIVFGLDSFFVRVVSNIALIGSLLTVKYLQK
jgi:hypothetical protein